ncbi:Zinc finger MYM-type protein 1 [Eumeta japonica]|uniref:Zinc finger MYM-type protein 1 n=1 Tax=Eumeta variegata TaxID=151549 RepID=A0A4C2A242_EUMVA|nr:Zinc finger MYM-type protein 1 [Eumeta japonica]
MSAPRKKLSGAEYRKKAKYKELQGKQCADNMKNWLRRGGDPSVSAATSEVDIELENVSSTLPDQTNQDFSQSDLTVQTSPSLSMCDEQPEQLEKTKPEYERSKSPHLDSDELQKTGFDLTDPGNWPVVEKMTDEQRSFFSNQAVLLAENQPENIEFRSTERNGRHLTSSMWYRMLSNCERVKRSWLIFSKTKNAVFCACCKIYQKPSSTATSALCSTGFINWKKVSERLSEHEATQMHKECMIKWKTRVQQMKSCQGIDQDIERVIHSEKEKWRQILRVVMDAVLYLSTNCLSFRGCHETPSDLITQYPHPSQGNFLNLISLLAKHNSTLKFQLEHLKKGQVSYLSKTIQNEIIDIMAKTVKNSILNDIKEAKYYTIMFDCTPDVSHTEQMSQVIRYVKRTGDACEIKESFIDFIEVAGKTGEDICQQILEKLAVDDLDIGQCRGQSYDNGSNMASIHKGVQARIAERNELAEFVPCLAHSLNLVGVHSASSCQEAINLFGLIQKYIVLLAPLLEIAKALEEVKQTSRAPEAKYEAGHLLSAIKDFKFILNLTIWANILREINRVNIEIQKEDIILARSVALMDGLLKTLQNMRQNPMEYWIKEAEEVAEKVVLTLFCKTNEFRNVKNISMRCVTTSYKHSNLFNYFLKK